jgi:adenylate kinase family enzyme
MKSIIIVVGSTGAGKTTHSRLLAEKTGAHYISSGDIARSFMDKETSELFHQGQLSPHEVAIRAEVIRQIDAHEVIVLDGFPRKPEQYTWLKEATEAEFFVVKLDWTEKVLVNRWIDRTRNEHDTLKAYALRHELYRTDTEPMFTPNLVVGGNKEKEVMEVNLLIRNGVLPWIAKINPGFKCHDSSKQQAIDKFIHDHHVSRWGLDRANTYVVLDKDLEGELWKLINA